MSSSMRKSLQAAHSPAARRKAAATQAVLATLRQELAEKHHAKSRDFQKPHLLATAKRLHIPLSAIPEGLFKPFGVKQRKELLMIRQNGHGNGGGIGIPLDAIPERVSRKTAAGSYAPKSKAHPNAELIGKVVDLLAKPDISSEVGQRLLAALEKLLA